MTTLFICGERDDAVAEEVGGEEVVFMERPHRAMRGIKLSTLWRLYRYLRANPCDIVIAQRYRPVYFAGILSLITPISVVLGITHEHRVYRSRARRRVIRYGTNIVLVGVSESVSSDIERDCPGLRDAGRLFTVPNAIDPAYADDMSARETSRDALGLPADGFCFGTVGRLIDKKRHDVLLDGFARYRSAGGRARLVIVGTGPCRPALERQAIELGLTGEVHFAGHVANGWRYLKAFDAFVLASGELEAFGVVLIEAMLARLPIVCSSAPGPAEVVGDAALMFDVGDAAALAQRLAEMSSMEPAARAEMGDKAFTRFQDAFTPAVFRQRLRSLEPIRRVMDAV